MSKFPLVLLVLLVWPILEDPALGRNDVTGAPSGLCQDCDTATSKAGEEGVGQPTGHFLSPMGVALGLTTVEVEVQDPDGLERVWVTFVDGGAPLLLCGSGAPGDCPETAGLLSREEIDPLDFGAVLGPVTASLWVRDFDGIQEIAAEVTFLLEEDVTPRHSLTVFKQGEGTGSLQSIPVGIDCSLSCNEQSFEFVDGTEVEIVATGDDFTGFAGDLCFGTAPCQLTIDRDRELFATFDSQSSFRVLSTRPIADTTDFPTSMPLRVVFDREIQPGPTWAGISILNELDQPLEIAPSIPSSRRDLILISATDMEPGVGYRLSVPAGAVRGQGNVYLADDIVLSFSTIEDENSRLSLAMTPDLLVEGETATFDLWLDRPSSSDRIVQLEVEPIDALVPETQTVVVPAGQLHTTFFATVGEVFEDSSALLRATEPQLGGTALSVFIADLSPSNDLPLRLDSWSLIEDDNENGILDAGENTKFRMILCNEGTSPIPQYEVCLSVVDVARHSLLRPLTSCELIGFSNPGQCRFQDVRFHSDPELPPDEYWVRIESSVGPLPFVAHAPIQVQNFLLPNYELARTYRDSDVLQPRDVVHQMFIAHNRGDGSDSRLPELRFEVKNTDGQVVQEYQGFIDARRDTDLLYFLAFEAPEESGEYHVTAEINPLPDAVPETTTDDNQTDPFSFVVNRAMTLDPVGGPYRVAMGEPFTLAISAQDPEGDSLEFQLPGAPNGMGIQSTGPQSARIQWIPSEAQEPYSREIQVEVRDGLGRSQSDSFILNIDRRTDLEIHVSAARQSYVLGLPLIFEAEVRNRGPLLLAEASFFGTSEPSDLATSWTCSAGPGSTCGGSGTQLQDLELEIATGGVVTYTFTTHLPSEAPDLVYWNLCVRPDPPTFDGNDENDCGTVAFSRVPFDFGDAPTHAADQSQHYPVELRDDGARHGVGFLRLGRAIDGEDNGQPSPEADADDTSGLDEDGLVISPALVGDLLVITADSTGPGLLSAWIDWNRDGDWLDEDEKALTDYLLDGEGAAKILLPVPDAAVPGTSIGRFRLSTRPGLGIGGPAPDGEVEDHSVEIVTADAVALAFEASVESGTLPEPGGLFEVFLEATNAGSVPLRLESLQESGQPLLDSCPFPLDLEPTESLSCSFWAEHLGNAGDSASLALTAFASTLGGSQQLVQEVEVSVPLLDVLPGVDSVVTVQPEQIPSGGGLVTFSLGITNTSAAEALTLDALTSDPLGDLHGLGTCNVPGLLPVGATYSCAFTSQLQGNPGDSLAIEISARVTDDEGNNVWDSEPSTIDIAPALADLTVELSDHRIYAAPGRPITYRARVRNLGPEAAAQATVEAVLPAELFGCQWTCEAALGTCTAAGSRDLQDSVTLEPDGWALYTIRCEIDSDAEASGFLIPTAEVEPAPTTLDPAPENNSATDVTELAPLIFADGFESGDTSGWDRP